MSSYVLFGRSSSGSGTRSQWIGSGGENSQPGTTPGSTVPASAFNADVATGAGTVLAGAGAADYLADGVRATGDVAMFNLTESPAGTFASPGAAALAATIASDTALFGAANTTLDQARSAVDLAAATLNLALTDQDWNAIKNLEVGLDSATSFRDIRLENFVDTRLKIGDLDPEPSNPQGAVFDVEVLGAKRGEVDASHAPQAINLLLAPWTNGPGSQNSFDVKGSIFNDTVAIEPGSVVDSPFGQSESWYDNSSLSFPDGAYLGVFTTVFANLGAGNDQLKSEHTFIHGRSGNPHFASREVVWGGTGDDVIVTGHGADKLFGDIGSGSSLNPDPVAAGGVAGNDHLDAGAGADWIEGNGDTGIVGLLQSPDLIVNGSFEQFDRTPDADTISHQGGKWFTLDDTLAEPEDNLPGWECFNGAIELQTNAVGGPAFDGLIKLELDSHPDFGLNSFTILAQGAAPLPGVSYHLSFAYAPRAGAPTGSSAFEFSFNNFIDGDPGNIVASFANDDPGWHVFEADIVGTGFGLLTFSPAGPLDTLGALIDDVRVMQELTLDLSFAGDAIDCGDVQHPSNPFLPDVPDFERDVVNFNLGDGFDVVINFGAGSIVIGPPIEPGLPPQLFDPVNDVLRIENVGVLTTEVVFSDQGHGTLVQNGAGSVFLVGVTTPLTQSVDGNYLLLFDAA